MGVFFFFFAVFSSFTVFSCLWWITSLVDHFGGSLWWIFGGSLESSPIQSPTRDMGAMNGKPVPEFIPLMLYEQILAWCLRHCGGEGARLRRDAFLADYFYFFSSDL
jgi:hypothetical protein